MYMEKENIRKVLIHWAEQYQRLETICKTIDIKGSVFDNMQDEYDYLGYKVQLSSKLLGAQSKIAEILYKICIKAYYSGVARQVNNGFNLEYQLGDPEFTVYGDNWLIIFYEISDNKVVYSICYTGIVKYPIVCEV